MRGTLDSRKYRVVRVGNGIDSKNTATLVPSARVSDVRLT